MSDPCRRTETSAAAFIVDAETLLSVETQRNLCEHSSKKKKKERRLHQTACLIAISIYCSDHINLYKTEGSSAVGSKEAQPSLSAADQTETGAFYSHVSQPRRVCSLILNKLPKTLQESKAGHLTAEQKESLSLQEGCFTLRVHSPESHL